MTALQDSEQQSLSANLKRAKKHLKTAQQEAVELRKNHLKALLNHAIAANQKKKTKALIYLIRAECNK